jgi:hypothetical protein
MPAAVTLTIAEAATILDPPLTERQLRAIIRELRWQPAAWRHPGTGRGHPVAAYDWAQISRLHTALLPWLETRDDADVLAGN